MLIAVDIGNTNIVIGFIDGDDIVGTYRLTTSTRRTSDEYAMMLATFMGMSHIEPKDVDDVIISSVVPKVMYAFRSSIKKFLDLEPIIVGPGVKCGINVRVDDPKTVGADRIADCAGAYYLYGGPVLVIDFGTATTYDYVDDTGTFCAGVISTGLESGASSLWSHTAQLPEVEITKPDTILATGTKTAMQAGLYYQYLGGVEYTINRFRKEIGHDFKVVATGGLGNVFYGDTDSIDVYDRQLIFKGLAIIYAKIQAQKTAQKSKGRRR
ncbi:type III pantothenate kinase [Bifidobacterium simiarum]|uniref:Type III pantothenate kinase n=1 Tax=Bifidobacterium simiarum TaxID=2045441 RepID=A0A2M9HFE6_9BIFI|nr:type III pantothenate kinase [Bifidobacterium simiarum]MBT1166511.1 type III pantothenate kinase [Bifidobacterium simiarum]PJM75540.1 pantothenate kinase [Bifidobacterium simiarum]